MVQSNFHASDKAKAICFGDNNDNNTSIDENIETRVNSDWLQRTEEENQ